MINEAGITRDMVVVGGSAGSLAPVLTILKALPADLPVTLALVIHRSPTFESQLDSLLGRVALLPVSEPADGDPVGPGRIYVAPRDHHLTVHRDRWRLTRGPKIHWARPAVDPLFSSMSMEYGNRVLGILLSGGGADGVGGLLDIKSRGGLSIAQDPVEAPHESMPVHAILDDHVDAVMRSEEIARAIPILVRGKAHESRPVRGRPPIRAARSTGSGY